MGSKYTTQSASGYNSSPPADDGSQNAANLVAWSTIKTKLNDPVKTLADAINTALVSALDFSVRQITVADSTVAGDHMRTVEIAPTVSNTVTVALGDAATMTSNYIVRIKNSSTISQVIGRATGADTIDGVAANISIPSKSSIILGATTGANGYLVLGRSETYEEGSFTATLTGVSGTVTGTAYYTKVGNTVTVDWPALSGTSNATSKTITGMPAGIRPSSTKYVGSLVVDNGGTQVVSYASLASGGTLTLYATAGSVSAAWTGSGTASVTPFSMQYTRN